MLRKTQMGYVGCAVRTVKLTSNINWVIRGARGAPYSGLKIIYESGLSYCFSLRCFIAI
jgi:hypothetical protein